MKFTKAQRDVMDAITSGVKLVYYPPMRRSQVPRNIWTSAMAYPGYQRSDNDVQLSTDAVQQLMYLGFVNDEHIVNG